MRLSGDYYSCGNGAQCTPWQKCSSDSNTFSSRGASSLQESFIKTVEGSVSAGGWGVKGSFTASDTFQEMSFEMNENR